MHTSYVSASPWRLLIILLTCTLALSGAATLHATSAEQNLHFKFLGREQGLHAGIVYCVMQDRQGFIWLGTRFGLKRYDGYEFKSYDALPSDPAQALSGPITAICEDSVGTLWIVIKGAGIASLDRQTNQVTYYQNDPLDPTSLGSEHISVLQIDKLGDLWAISQTWQVHRYDRSRNRFVRYEPPNDLRPSATALFSLPILDGRLLLPTSKGDLSFDLGKHTYHIIPSIASRLGRLTVMAQIDDSLCFAVSWLDTGDYTHWFIVNVQTRRIVMEIESEMLVPVRGCVFDSKNDLLILSVYSGLFSWNARSRRVIQVPLKELSDPQCLFLDRSNGVWIGAAGGVFFSDGASQNFSSYQLTPHRSGRISVNRESSPVRALHAQGSRIQAGDQIGAVFEWDPDRRHFHFVDRLKTADRDPLLHSLHQISNDHQGRWIYATNSGPLFTRATHVSRARPGHILRADAYAVQEDHTHSLWIGTANFDPLVATYGKSLLRYDPSTGVGHYYTLRLPTRSEPHAKYVFSMYEDRSKQLWIGSSSGLFKYDRARDTCIPLLHPRCDGSGHAPNNIWVIFEDSRENLWLGSWGRGLHRFDRATNTYTDFTTREGLPDNNIQSILEDERGDLWIGTSKGLSRFDPTTNVFTNFSIGDGLLDEEFQPKAATKLASGEMFFGSLTGITSFFPSQIKPLEHNAPIALTSMHVSGRETGQLFDGETLHLGYDSSDLVFEYAALNFGSNDRMRYDYMLVGLDDDWVHAGTRRTASYNNIPPGEYRLRLRGSDGNGRSVGDELQIYVSVSPPYWETWWFRLVAGLSIVGSASFVVLRRLRGQQEQHLRIERAREKERMELAGDIHDGPLQDLYATRFLLDDDNSELARLLVTVRSDLRSISSVLQPPKLQSGLVEELDILLQAFRQRCPDTAFALSTTGVPLRLPEGVGRNIFRIVRTALTNVQKHSKASSCKVDVKFSANTLQLSIRDNGVGFDATTVDQLGREHFGLFLMKCYAKEIKAAIKIDAVEGQGTEIDIRWRLHRFRSLRTRSLQKLQYTT